MAGPSSEAMQECIALCWQCRTECMKALYDYCLRHGGRLSAREHIRILTDCIEVCQTAADFMVRRSPLYTYICEACAATCESCAESCAEIDGDEMDKCAEICRDCAASCREMGGYTILRGQRAAKLR